MRALRALFAVAIALGGCGGTTETAGRSMIDERDVSQACEALARESCDRRGTCEARGGSGQRFASDEECRERWALACRCWVTVPDAKLAPHDVEACADEIARSSCGVVSRLAGTSPARLPACLRIAGARAQGTACTDDAQCETSFCKHERTGSTCAAPPEEPGYEGDACGAGAVCAGALRCEEGRCARGECPDTGCFDYYASCGGVDDPARMCPEGTECVNQSDRGAGQCAPYAGDGAPCGEYDGPRCLFPARCVAGTCLVRR